MVATESINLSALYSSVADSWKVTPGGKPGRTPYKSNTPRTTTVVIIGVPASATATVRASIGRIGRRDGATERPGETPPLRPPLYPKRGGAQLPRHVGCRQHLAWTHQGPEAHWSASRAECLLRRSPAFQATPEAPRVSETSRRRKMRIDFRRSVFLSIGLAVTGTLLISDVMATPASCVRPAPGLRSRGLRPVDRPAGPPAADRPPAAGFPLRHPPTCRSRSHAQAQVTARRCRPSERRPDLAASPQL